MKYEDSAAAGLFRRSQATVMARAHLLTHCVCSKMKYCLCFPLNSLTRFFFTIIFILNIFTSLSREKDSRINPFLNSYFANLLRCAFCNAHFYTPATVQPATFRGLSDNLGFIHFVCMYLVI